MEKDNWLVKSYNYNKWNWTEMAWFNIDFSSLQLYSYIEISSAGHFNLKLIKHVCSWEQIWANFTLFVTFCNKTVILR